MVINIELVCYYALQLISYIFVLSLIPFSLMHSELDATPTEMFSSFPINIYLSCYGPSQNSCGCAQTTISLLDPSGIESCEIRGNSSKVFEDRCVIDPVITVERISKMSYMNSASSLGGYNIQQFSIKS
jgi:hypothetical protein